MFNRTDMTVRIFFIPQNKNFWNPFLSDCITGNTNIVLVSIFAASTIVGIGAINKLEA